MIAAPRPALSKLNPRTVPKFNFPTLDVPSDSQLERMALEKALSRAARTVPRSAPP